MWDASGVVTMMRSRSILRSLMLAALAVTASSGARAEEHKPPPAAHAPVPAPIDRNGVLILIRSALIALDQANKTGNYTVMRDLGAPGFQVNSAARLAEIFATSAGIASTFPAWRCSSRNSPCCRRSRQTA